MTAIQEIDEKIARLADDLATLKKARSLLTGQRNIAPTRSNGKSDGEHGTDARWFSVLAEVMADRWMGMKEIHNAVREHGYAIGYQSAYQWMKRAIKRGEYKKRGTRYHLVSGGGDA